mgnify:CR=1 FL=1
MFTHSEELAIPSSAAEPRVKKRFRDDDPVVLDTQARKTFTRSQRKRYDEECACLSYSDEAMWSQLKPATMPMPLPRGCRALMMELLG